MTLYLLASFLALDPPGASGVILKLAVRSSPVIDSTATTLLLVGLDTAIRLGVS